MDTAIWLASIFGPYLVILGLWMLLYNDNYQKVVTSMKNTPAIFSLIGCFNVLIGLTILSEYNMWMGDLSFFVTLLGWFLVVRGVFSLFMPQVIIKWMLGNQNFLRVKGLFPLVWGILLCGLAFMK